MSFNMNSPVQENSYENRHFARWRETLVSVNNRLQDLPRYQQSGRITRAAGLVLEATGIQLPLGSFCLIDLPGVDPRGDGTRTAEAEVVGFGKDTLFLMPLTVIEGLVPGARVYCPSEHCDRGKRFPVGMNLLGRVVDGFGDPIDGKGPLHPDSYACSPTTPINPLDRKPIEAQIDTGIRAINALFSIGEGQRIGLFAGSGVGKSVLLGMIARYTSADIVIVALIGERGREVKEFIEHSLGAEGLTRAVVVATPADNSPLQRLHGASYATLLAEYFRDAGHRVLLFMDSLTRFAMAQREIALAVGEAPATRGYPPSVFARLPALIERAGNGASGSGSLTAIYTVLTEADDLQDPIADASRAILDGHIVLSRQLAESGHFPAIDVEASISRSMDKLVGREQLDRALEIKRYFSIYQRNQDLISLGAYSPGHDPLLDVAVANYPAVEAFLQQNISEKSTINDSLAELLHINGDRP
ncbi:flagellum-specific ATP synthase [Halioglobus japonicus]|nr:flagellum-specific ATP synthase [Halioglobus japonicus]